MDFVKQLLDVFLHLDRHLAEVVRDYGTFTNVILFGIVFCETVAIYALVVSLILLFVAK